MSKAITDKTFVVVVTGIGRIYVNPKEAENIKAIMTAGNTETIVIGESMINVRSIHGVSPAKDIDDADRRRRGDYQCQYGYWHEKGNKCAHEQTVNWK